ncbi:hypothetical protein [Sphaerotilus sp.]|uniref:hypothetical protein n=1 Tax=Sphaerotilus sp. TaxID=2093942 RepID=UPI0034E19F6E
MKTAQIETLKRRGFDDTVSFPEVREILGWTDGKIRRAVMSGEIVPVFWMESFGTRNAHYLDDGSPAHVLHGNVYLQEPTQNGGRDCHFTQAANFRIDGLNMAGLSGDTLAARPAVGETLLGLDLVMAHGLVPIDQVAALLAQTTAAPTSAPAVAVPEPVAPPAVSKEARQARRYQACVDAGLRMPTDTYTRLPTGIKRLAEHEGISRQAFAEDVKAHIGRLHGR